MPVEEMAEDKKISVPQISLPKGGGAIKGIGETFQPNPFNGTGHLSIPIYTSPCRNFEPKLSLDYSSGSGNSVFSIGFSLSIPNVSRKTEKGLPKYQDLDSDTFILSNAEDLVPRMVKQGNKWIRDEKTITVGGEKFKVIRYRPRTEGLYARIELWLNLPTGDMHWEVVSKNNIKSIYGKSPQARIVDPDDPDNPLRVFKWLIEETTDSKGNKILYQYQGEDERNVPVHRDINESNRVHTANKYIKRIIYGNYFDRNDSNKEKWTFEVVFDYGEHTDQKNPYNENNAGWPKRKDSFSSYRSGFEIRTHRLCRRVLMFHHFPGEDGVGEKCLVRSTDFEYDETAIMTFLKAVKQKAYKKQNNNYESAEMPPVEFKYTTFNVTDHTFEPLTVENGGTIPDLINQSGFQMLDLYGEGISGILYSDDSTILYWRNRGEGDFAEPQTVCQFPIERELTNPQYTLMDLGGDGKLDLVVQDPQRAGFYQSNPDRTWEPFKSFESYPVIDFQGSNKEMVDTNGDGFADVMVVANAYLAIYPSKAKSGFNDPVKLVREYHEDAFPGTNLTSGEETIRFADMFGDGLSHRVRISNGIVECWPNLGYGRFGRRVLFGKAPRFDEKMDASRLFLADIDGSGTADLIYAHHDRIDVYFNKSGNSFSKPVSIPLPQGFDNHDQIQIADVLGNGTSCLVLTKNRPGYRGLRHDCYDFTGGIKPHLLIQMTNNMGATTRIRYASSTKFYLDDEEAGKPWISRLPFPVHLVEKTETIDHISGSKLVTRYKYHHGFYDGGEREFRGFGYVEQWDTESFDQYSQTDLIDDTPFEIVEEGLHVPPVYTKTWFHTGAYQREGILSRQYEKEYYSGHPNALLLPDSVFDNQYNEIDMKSIREAYRAFRGQVLRQEVYSQDNKPGLAEHPYTVTESNFKVRLEQPKQGLKHAVYFVHPYESISYLYERDASDPRISHSFTLQVDEYGNIIKSCSISYPREKAQGRYVYPEQAQTKAMASINTFINKEVPFHLLGIPCEQKSFEIGGLALQRGRYFSFREIESQLAEAEANMIRFDEDFSPNRRQARLLTWQRHYYWNIHQDDVLPLGQCTNRALLHHSEAAVFSAQQIRSVFGGKVTPALLRGTGGDEGGYVLSEGYWWNKGLIRHYYKEQDQKFHLPVKTTDPFGVETIVNYDNYSLLPVRVRDAKDNVSEAVIDYVVLQPKKLTDSNDNVSELVFDILGMVKVTSIHGIENGRQKGDMHLIQYQERPAAALQDVLNRPSDYLQEATSFFYYDLFAWKDRGKPVFSLNLLRETHVSELQGAASQIQYHLAYSDGFGRDHQKKIKVEPGQAISLNEAGEIVEKFAHNRWLVSGRTVYNNKAKPVKQYEPFYRPSPDYEPEKKLTEYGVTPVIHYDPLVRVIRTDLPKGFFSKVEFSPWMQRTWDENDTAADSRFYTENKNNNDPGFADEKDALDKALMHYDTPQEVVLNNLGQRFLVIEEKSKGQQLLTRYELDIQGNELTITDPRQHVLNNSRLPQDRVKNFTHIFDMSGSALSVDSVDAGLSLTLNNALGQTIHSWDSRGFHIKTKHDALQRPTEVHVKGNGLNQVVERMEYGEGPLPGDGKDKNLRGKLVKHCHQAGVQYFDLYSIKGEIRKYKQVLREDYKTEVNWNNPAVVVLENESFHTENIYDALGRVIRQINPDKSIYKPAFHQSGLLKQVTISFPDDHNPEDFTDKIFVEDISYNAKGQREKIIYGNEVSTKYTYEPETFRLKHLETFRIRDGKYLQDIHYTYDPIGNITRIIDYSHQKVFHDQSVVDPSCDYTYDALYRLTMATGREHPALARDNYKTGGFKQSQYLPLRQNVHANDVQKLQNYTQRYTYDDAGNLTQMRHIASHSIRSWTRNIIPSGTSNRTIPDAMGAGLNPEDFFDENGNMVELEHLRAINWNYRDNIASVDLIQRNNAPSDSEYYVYDGSGMRVRKVLEKLTNGGAVIEITEKIYLGNCEIKRIKTRENNDETTILERKTLHVTDDKQRIALVHHWTVDNQKRETDKIGQRKSHYQFSNHLGSASLELSDNADIISYEEYFPYGGTVFIAGRNQKEIKIKEYRYSGKERDDSTGLYYYGVRYFAPWLARWLSHDPRGMVDGTNLYKFVRNNPVRFSDPFGASSDDTLKLVRKAFEIQQENLVKAVRKYNKAYSEWINTSLDKYAHEELQKIQQKRVLDLYKDIEEATTEIKRVGENLERQEKKLMEKISSEAGEVLIESRKPLKTLLEEVKNLKEQQVIIGARSLKSEPLAGAGEAILKGTSGSGRLSIVAQADVEGAVALAGQAEGGNLAIIEAGAGAAEILKSESKAVNAVQMYARIPKSGAEAAQLGTEILKSGPKAVKTVGGLGSKILKIVPWFGISAGIYSYQENMRAGNYWSAGLDAFGLIPGPGDLVDFARLVVDISIGNAEARREIQGEEKRLGITPNHMAFKPIW